MAVPFDQFVEQLQDSGLIAPGRLEEFLPPQRNFTDARELATELIRNRLLTKYQLEQLLRRNTKSLFLGNYLILDKIGEGGMGHVFKARHVKMDRIVALKTLPPRVTQDRAAIARFEREVKAAARLDHPNIVAAFDANQSNDVYFLVMQYVEGSDLGKLVSERGPLSPEEAIDYTLQAARGLAAAHAEGVIHRDIKPSNLLLDKRGTVKILDMGLARLESAAHGPKLTSADLTSSGAVMGTVDFMPPEQALDARSADHRADIYSLGCTLYYLLTASSLYQGDSIMARLLAHRDTPIPRFRDVGLVVSERVEAVFRKMVAKRPDDRYQSARELIFDLERSLTGHEPTVSEPIAGIRIEAAIPEAIGRITVRDDEGSPRQKKPTLVGRSGGVGRGILIGAGTLAVLLLVAAVAISQKSNRGTVIVTVDQPGVLVRVLDEKGKVEFTRRGMTGSLTISVDPGRHRLAVDKDGFAAFRWDFEIQAGFEKPITANLMPLETAAALLRNKPWQTPTFRQWMNEVSSSSPEKQVEAVAKKLTELNPGFDGNLNPAIENGLVTGVQFQSANVVDVSPLRALRQLRNLGCPSSRVSDLSPLEGMPLTSLNCEFTPVSDLSPLRRMRLTELRCRGTKITDLAPLEGMPLASLFFPQTSVPDLSPLRGMPLRVLYCSGQVSDLSPLRGMPLVKLDCQGAQITDLSPLIGTPLKSLNLQHTPVSDLSPLLQTGVDSLFISGTRVPDLSLLKQMKLVALSCGECAISDLSPIKGLPLKVLSCYNCPVSDLTPLEGMQLTVLAFTPKNITKGIEIVRNMKSLETILLGWNNGFPRDEFWKRYDAGEFNTR